MSVGNKFINTDQFSGKLREKGIIKSEKKILITNFEKSDQIYDITLPTNCNGYGRIHHFNRSMGEGFPENPLPIDPASKFFNIPFSDQIKVQVFQNAICSWRCWYCFVDNKLLSANKKYSDYKTVTELVDLYLREKDAPKILDLSGGQPDLVPEWSLWMLDEIEKKGLSKNIYVWSDDNLSNDYLWKYLSKNEIRRLSKYQNYARVGCFKGYDEDSFSFNTQAKPELFNRQFNLMKKLVEHRFNVYGYATFTTTNLTNISKKISHFVDRLQNEIHEYFPVRTVPLRIYKYTPTLSRMNKDHEIAIENQKEVMSAWIAELEKRFSKEDLKKRIHEHKLA